MLLNEIFDKVSPWMTIKQDKHTYSALFNVNGKKYVFFATGGFGVWGIMFYLLTDDDARIDITGSGNQFEIFSTVIDIIKHFISIYNPQVVEVDAVEHNRKRLYVKHILPKALTGWKIEIRDDDTIECWPDAN